MRSPVPVLFVAFALALSSGCGDPAGGGGGTTDTPPTGTVTGMPTGPVAIAATITLNASTLVPPAGVSITSVSWTWGDATPVDTSSATADVTHAYTGPGTYTLTIVCSYDDGTTGTLTATIDAVDPTPTGTITGLPTGPVAINQTVTLNASTLAPPAGLTIASVAWDWGDATPDDTTAHTADAAHAYAAAGTFTLTVTCDYGGGLTGETTASIEVLDDSVESIDESARDIPVLAEVDVLVVGGTTGGVAAAKAAADAGATVFLAARRHYLGSDMCGSYRLWTVAGEVPGDHSALAQSLYAGGDPATPLHVKKTLDEALTTAGVTFRLGCFATDVLRDGADEVAGVVFANRAGRQAVTAKVVVDATLRGHVARLAGATFSAYPAGAQTFDRVVVGGAARTGGVIASSTTQSALIGAYDVHEYVLSITMADGSYAAFMEAEQHARAATFDAGQVDASEFVWQTPPDEATCVASMAGAWPGAASADLDAFRPSGVDRVYLVSGVGDVARAAAAALLRPLEYVDLGLRVGAAAAADAGGLAVPSSVSFDDTRYLPVAAGDVGEALIGERPTGEGTPALTSPLRSVPVLGEYDVVVIGGGTGGAPAGIGAGREGATTLLVEFQHALGGVSTLGLIGQYYYGNRVGFTSELDSGVAAMSANTYVIAKQEWYRNQNRAAGTETWFGALGCGAFVDGTTVKGVVVATPEGRGVVLADAVIDSTGNADVAAAAGAQTVYTGGEHVAVQGAGLPNRELDASYTNTDYTFAYDHDMADVWHLFTFARIKFGSAYDLGQLIDTRERRRIVGDFVMSPMDIVNGRTYPDTVVVSTSNFDSHGYAVHPLFLMSPPDHDQIWVDVPYRCLLPAGIDGILVTGLGISAHRDAMPVIRMQPDVQNQGYAAGLAAAMAASGGTTPRLVDMPTLQNALLIKGNLPSRVLTDTDSYPYTDAEMDDAVTVFLHADDTDAVFVDDDDASCTLAGTWTASSATPGYYGTGYHHCNLGTGNSATFAPDVATAGNYEVYLRWTAHSNRPQLVNVTVNYDGGSANYVVNQEQDGGAWNLLGTHPFAVGTGGTVVLVCDDEEPNEYVIADAVALAPEGSGNPDGDPLAALPILLTRTSYVVPQLQAAHGDAGTSAAAKLRVAQFLGMLGDATGAATLAAAVDGEAAWDTGWNYTGMGQFGASLSPLDANVIALGKTGDAAALAPVLAKCDLLDANEAFSHHRACAVALEELGDAAAASHIAAVLAKADMTGHHVTTLAEAQATYGSGGTETGPRNKALRELVLARALYRLGDAGGAGAAILNNFANDLRGHFAKHARAVLDGQ